MTYFHAQQVIQSDTCKARHFGFKKCPLHAKMELNVSLQWIVGNYSLYKPPAPTFEEILWGNEGQVCFKKSILMYANSKVSIITVPFIM